MDVNSLYTNIPQEEGIKTVCEAYESFCKNDTPIPTHSLPGLVRLVLQEHSFQFKEKNYYRLTALQWGPKLRSPLQTFFCLQKKKKLSIRAKLNPLSGKGTSMMCSPCVGHRKRGN